MTQASAFGIPNGAAQTQENLQSLGEGVLRARGGLVVDASHSVAARTEDLYNCQHPLGDSLVFRSANATLKTAGRLSKTLKGGVGDEIEEDAPWSFAKARNGDLIGVNGKQRGIRWNVYDDSADKLGLNVGTPSFNVAAKVGTAATKGGSYDMAIRFKDADERGGPIYSALSAKVELSFALQEENNLGFNWGSTDAIPSADPDGRATHVELWRTAADAPGVFYLIHTMDIGTTTYTSDTSLTDTALIDAAVADPDKRLSVVDPFGNLIARRQETPPEDKAVVVWFQDRMFYMADTADTTTATRNQIFYSHPDEPESVPSTNVITPQENTGDDDDIIGGFAFGSLMYILKKRHILSMSFARQPRIDANVRLIAKRGALNYKSWDILEGVAYLMDQSGCYAMTPSGGITPISEPIQDVFRLATSPLDFSKTIDWFVKADPRHEIVRFHVNYTTDGVNYPKRALCYHIRNNAWWTEKYHEALTSAARTEIDGQQELMAGGASSGTLRMNQGTVDPSSAAIVWTYKSKILRIAPANQQDMRRVSVVSKPTSASDSMTLKTYHNRSATATNWGLTVPTAEGAGVSTTAGNASATLDQTKADGHHQIRFDSLKDDHVEVDRYLEVELSGSQSSEAHEVYEITVDGVS